jgi:large subunit ribosomal protein L24
MIKKGDNVKVITGSSKGKSGKVLEVLRDEGRVIVEGVNIKKVHKKKTSSKPGQIVEIPMAINISNVKLDK